VRQQINKMRPEPAGNQQQLVMPGFERLQTHYLVERDKERVAVRIDHLTDDEIEAKACEQETMGRACFQHADELRRYRDLRSTTQADLPLARSASAPIYEARP
jgi:hypothetical protein